MPVSQTKGVICCGTQKKFRFLSLLLCNENAIADTAGQKKNSDEMIKKLFLDKFD